MQYLSRVADGLLSFKLEAFGAVNITGPKGCGKTTTAKQQAKSIVEFQDEDLRAGYLAVAETQPSRLLEGDKPRLFDEWQDAPKIWGAIRKSIDDTGAKGMYILTGSTSSLAETTHTGTLRISSMKMLPMSLFESKESNGSVSVSRLFDEPDSFDGCRSTLSFDELIFAICRGGWPGSLSGSSDAAKLEVAKDLFRQTAYVDISSIDRTKRNPLLAEAILRSYARNLCTLADTGTLLADVRANYALSETAFYEYLGALEKLFIVDDITAWSPSIRSKTSIRSSRKRNLVDPSIAVAALGISPSYFNTDFKTLGFLFESLCIRDLQAYLLRSNGTLSYYRDRYGLESDIVAHLGDGRYALIEVKLGENGVDEGARHLLEIEALVTKYNETEKQAPLRVPDLKIVLTGTEYGYRRPDGVFVIPIGCLRD
ncbi:MAG: DUF4143 domain-containing protein [Propionibacteriaceae bacterium]|jgi:predicted AAA+ superfamily ATPase|nr:DUF4143 domain-containing protein [Propionibacteriaceae bacterium]